MDPEQVEEEARQKYIDQAPGEVIGSGGVSPGHKEPKIGRTRVVRLKNRRRSLRPRGQYHALMVGASDSESATIPEDRTEDRIIRRKIDLNRLGLRIAGPFDRRYFYPKKPWQSQ